MSPVQELPQEAHSRPSFFQAPPAIYPQVSDFWTRNTAALPAVPYESSFWEREFKFDSLMEAARRAELIDMGWDGYDAPAPSQASIDNGIALLNKIKETELTPPYSVLPSANGGIGISFRGKGSRRAVLEILNDGSCSFLVYGKGQPKSSGEFDARSADLTSLFNLLSENL